MSLCRQREAILYYVGWVVTESEFYKLLTLAAEQFGFDINTGVDITGISGLDPFVLIGNYHNIHTHDHILTCFLTYCIPYFSLTMCGVCCSMARCV